jgi:hypothetical protein
MNSNLLTQTQGFEVSDKYRVIPTQSIIDRLVDKGFQVEKMVITRPRQSTKDGFQRHMVRLSHRDLVLRNVNDSRPELVIVNSYDGSSSLKIMLGVYRLVCSNGLVIGSTVNQTRIRHVGDVWTQLDASLVALTD